MKTLNLPLRTIGLDDDEIRVDCVVISLKAKKFLMHDLIFRAAWSFLIIRTDLVRLRTV